ncbi:MAG: glutamate synthase-related protein [Nanoarchaeota archaeon]|nr:glutamate synthase-related protein [Nanoarchaeota archaeon]
MYSKIGSSQSVGSSNRTPNDINPISGLCGACLESCIGLCEVGKSAIRGPETIYPQPFGDVTASAVKAYPVDWGDFNILGTAVGACGIKADSDQATFPNVKVEIKLGAKGGKEGIKLRLPITIPGLGSTDVARKNWEGLAAGSALSGVLLTVGENVVGMDPDAKIVNGEIKEAPALKKRIDDYKKWQQDGYGAIIVQENVEDNRLGVLEFALKNGVDAVELKWGQGAKNIGGEVKIRNLKKAQMLKERGYIVLPDPTDVDVIKAFEKKVFREFERHSRLGMVSEEAFAKRVEELRAAGAKYLFLKTGAYRFEDLARALAFSSKYEIDVLTVDAAGGGTGMSPWRMMNEWGTPPIETYQKTFEYAEKLAKAGKHVPDIVIAGGFSLEDHIFKGIAFGAPYVKAIGMSRAPLTAVMSSSALWRRIDAESEQSLSDKYGREKDEIFFGSTQIKSIVGDKFDELPVGALGVSTYFMRVSQGLRQLMAGARKFNLAEEGAKPIRDDLVALTKGAAEISKIPFIMDLDTKKAEEILSKA